MATAFPVRDLTAAVPDLRRLSLISVFLVSAAFFMFNGSQLIGAQYFTSVELGTVKYVILFVVGLELLNMSVKRGLIQLTSIKFTTSAAGLFFGVFGTLAVLIPIMIYRQFTFKPISPGEIIALGVFTAIIVAPTETFFFQFTLPSTPVGPIMSQVTFGIFHYAAYGGNLTMMVYVMVLGFIWLILMRLKNVIPHTEIPVFGFAFVIASHVTLNLISSVIA